MSTGKNNHAMMRDKLLTIDVEIARENRIAQLANQEGATDEQIEVMLPYQPEPLLTVSYNDLMTLAKRLIAEQLDDCDEDFMAGRAHGIGSLHAEILGLAKQSITLRAQGDIARGMDMMAKGVVGVYSAMSKSLTMTQAQGAPKPAGAPETCRSSQKVQADDTDCDAPIIDGVCSCCGMGPCVKAITAAEQDKMTTDEARGALKAMPLGQVVEMVQGAARALPEQIACSSCGLTMAESRTLYEMKAKAPAQVVQEQNTATLAPRSAKSEASDALPSGQAQEVGADLAEEALSTLLWLYRRLPRGYGRPPTVEGPILALAAQTGIDVATCLAERGPDQQAPNENN